MATKIDVRILKTKEKLRQNLAVLLERKPIDKIMVAELCTLARVNRNTFYSHYEDINALFDELLETKTSAFLSNLQVPTLEEEAKNSFLLIHPLLEEIQANRRIYQEVFYSWRGVKFMTELFLRYEKIPEIKYNFEAETNQPSERDFFLFTVGGLSTLLSDWLAHDTKETIGSLENKIDCLIKALDQVYRNNQ